MFNSYSFVFLCNTKQTLQKHAKRKILSVYLSFYLQRQFYRKILFEKYFGAVSSELMKLKGSKQHISVFFSADQFVFIKPNILRCNLVSINKYKALLTPECRFFQRSSKMLCLKLLSEQVVWNLGLCVCSSLIKVEQKRK